jgi:hypothetical protein
LVPSINDDELWQEEPQVNQVEMDQRETSFVHISVVVQEQLDQIPLQQEEILLIQPKDDVPYTFPMIPIQDRVPQKYSLTDQCVDIKVYRDPIELRMEVFQQVDSKSFGSHAFMLIIVEIPCSKFQPTAFRYSFTSKYIKEDF